MRPPPALVVYLAKLLMWLPLLLCAQQVVLRGTLKFIHCFELVLTDQIKLVDSEKFTR